ncbi:MAG: hypothetical protein PUC73_02225 [Lachnospiraceae bacterium]|nr:hypothetical protein [Lachnospiraceae bacterium]
MIKKIMLFPIRVIFMLVGILMDLFIKAECWGGGIAFMILAICVVLAIVNQMWLQIGILAGIVGVGVVILFMTAEIKLCVEMIIEKLA